MRAKVITSVVLTLSSRVGYTVTHISYPFLYPLYPLLGKFRPPWGKVARYARSRQKKKLATQAVRLPAEFRFDGKEVFIRKDRNTGDVILSRLWPQTPKHEGREVSTIADSIEQSTRLQVRSAEKVRTVIPQGRYRDS